MSKVFTGSVLVSAITDKSYCYVEGSLFLDAVGGAYLHDNGEPVEGDQWLYMELADSYTQESGAVVTLVGCYQNKNDSQWSVNWGLDCNSVTGRISSGSVYVNNK